MPQIFSFPNPLFHYFLPRTLRENKKRAAEATREKRIASFAATQISIAKKGWGNEDAFLPRGKDPPN